MPERIARAPVRLTGGLPDGNLCGITTDEHKYWTADPYDEPEPRWAYVKYGRAEWKRGDHSGAEQATLEILEFEPAPDGEAVAQRVAELRSERVGQLPFPDEGSEEWDELQSLQRSLTEWQTEEGLSDVEVGERWSHVMGDADGGLEAGRKSVPRLREFLLTEGALPDPRRDEPAEGDEG